MLKDITNTFENNEEIQQADAAAAAGTSATGASSASNTSLSEKGITSAKPKSFSAEKDKKSHSSIEEEIKQNYFLLKEQLAHPIDSINAFATLKTLSVLYSEGKINAVSAQVDLLIELGLLDTILRDIESYCEKTNGIELQNAALWLLANVLALVSQEQILFLLEKQPVIDILIKFLQSDSANNIEQALWALANLISYIEIRNVAIQKKLVEKLLLLISKMTNSLSEKLFTLKINRTLTWLVSNLCRKPSPPYLLTVHFLPYLATMIHFNDDQIIRDSCLALGNLVLAENNSREDDHTQIEEIMSFNIGERCILLLESPNKEVEMAALVLLGHLTYGNEKQTQRLIEAGVLQGIKKILEIEECFERKKEALFALSNIVAGNSEELDRVIESGLLEEVRKVVTTTKKKPIVDEALFCFMNATYNASPKQMELITEMKVLEILMAEYRMRQKEDDKLLEDIAEAIDNMVEVVPTLSDRIEQALTKIGLPGIAEKKKKKLAAEEE